MQADRDQSHLFPEFRLKYGRILAYLNHYLGVHHPGYTAKMIEGFRPQARQVELYAQGRTTAGQIVTQKNGTTNPSNHQSAMAADCGIFLNGKYVEEPPQAIWDQLRHAAHIEGLVSGGDWPKFKDWPHVEWDTNDIASYKLARTWKKSAGLV